MARARAKINVREKGVTAAVEKLRAVGGAAHEQYSTMDDLARDAPRAISRIPEDSGRLRESFKDGAAEQYKRVNLYGYDVGTTVYYARFLFRGTEKLKARKPRVARKRLADEAALSLAGHIIRAQ